MCFMLCTKASKYASDKKKGKGGGEKGMGGKDKGRMNYKKKKHVV